jgi:hypothetical protein
MYLVQGLLPKLSSPEEFARRYDVYFQKKPPANFLL